MIRRDGSKKTPSIVNSAESETLEFRRGVDGTAHPSVLSSVVSSCNFRLRDDGSYALRMPDMVLHDGYVKTYDTNVRGTVAVVSDGKLRTIGTLDPREEATDVLLRYRDASGEDREEPYASVAVLTHSEYEAVRKGTSNPPASQVILDFDSKAQAAGGSMIIPALVNVSLTDIVDANLYPEGTAALPRRLSLWLDQNAEGGPKWVLEIINPEPNTLVDGGDGSEFETNLLLDNPYSARDLYGYGSVAVHGILAYQNPEWGDYGGTAPQQASAQTAASPLESLVKVICTKDYVYAYVDKHVSLVDLSRFLGDAPSFSDASELYEMDHEINLTVAGVVMKYDDEDHARSLYAGSSGDVFSAVIPAKTPIFEQRIAARDAAFEVTVNLRLSKDGSQGARFRVYPGDVSLDACRNATPEEIVTQGVSTFSVKCRYEVETFGDEAREFLGGDTVAELTENAGGTPYELASSVSADDERPIVLKAMMSFSKDMSRMYGVWEMSSNGGVSWTEVPEFLASRKTVSIPVVDQSKSKETLEGSSDYVRYVRAARISVHDEDDEIVDRVDALLLLTSPKTNQYRFTVYAYDIPSNAAGEYPRCVAFTDVADSHLELPKSGNSYVTGTIVHTAYQNGGIAVDIPIGEFAGQAVLLRYAATDDLSKTLTDDDCANVLTAKTSTGETDSILQHVYEASFVQDRGFTHSVRVRFAISVYGVFQRGYSVDVLYMYVNKSIRSSAGLVNTGIVARNKFNTFPEPSIGIQTDSGSLSWSPSGSGGGRPISVAITSSITPTTSTTFTEAGTVGVSYSMRARVSNPSNVPMVVALANNPHVDSPDADLVGPTWQSAHLGIGDSSEAMSFVVGTYITPPLNAGSTVKFVRIPPRASVEIAWDYARTSRALSASEMSTKTYGSIVRNMAHPLLLVTLSGRYTASSLGCNAFTDVSEFGWSPSHYISAIRTSWFYGDESPYGNYDDAAPKTYANGTLTKYENASATDTFAVTASNRAVLQSTLTRLGSFSDSTEYAGDVDMPDLSTGKTIYLEHVLLTYGVEKHGETLYLSGFDSHVTPLSNAIDFDFGADVTAVVPWRDYVVVFTESSTYMLIKDSSSSNGFRTRTVNTGIGVPKSDGDSVQAVLNGILFKSGDNAYVYVPGRYASVDTMLNIKRIGDPVAHLMRADAEVSSYVQDDEWHVFMRDADGEGSSELVYDYVRNVWTYHTHGYFPSKVFRQDTTWLMAIGQHSQKLAPRPGQPRYRLTSRVFSINRDYGDVAERLTSDSDAVAALRHLRYGDYYPTATGTFLEAMSAFLENGELSSFGTVRHIPYSIDTGQKSSRPTVLKQFLEAKFNLMSLDEKDAFPFEIGVSTDGMPHQHVVDANTDSPFWRESKNLDAGAASTTFGDDSTSNVGIMRQMFVKYSGRGKTLRITVSGESESRFAIYTVDSRYRVLPNKQ